MRSLGFVALIASASLAEGAVLLRRDDELSGLTTLPWTNKLEEGGKYGFLANFGDVSGTMSPATTCHAACGRKECSDPDLFKLAEVCFGPCTASTSRAVNGAVYPNAIRQAISCKILPTGWDKKKNTKADMAKWWKPATEENNWVATSSLAESTPSRPAREVTPEAEKPSATTPQSSTASPVGTTSPTATGQNPSSGASPVEVISGGVKQPVSYPVAITLVMAAFVLVW
ncbi:hypothetical protein CDD80_7483 [Ophiocordyceps camponoti-rufipedis]|uniref:Uncharacterized protein n=1 Tax=Ophiocordyceps camponoti-rufipedis TaxID=2004952 RepID=A0A2C5ZFQ5_9HYPO|nr:hypothetical protein CDD80_7483 [Ophiocordyceps camponoti-rufipedis]